MSAHSDRSDVNITTQRLGVYSGYIFIVLLFIGFGLVAGFFPPPSPNASAEEIQDQFQDDSFRIKLGMLISLISSAFILPWSATIITQIRRIEVGPYRPIVYLQIVGFGAFVILFVYPEMVWALTAYRPDDSAELVRKFNDLAWLGFISIVATAMMQMLALAYVILRDNRPKPVYPRWFAYFNVWVAIGFIPADIVFFFKTGPFAWDGIIGFGFSFFVFFSWTLLLTYMTGKAVTAQADEPEEEPENDELAGEVAVLRRQVAELMEAKPRTATDPSPALIPEVQDTPARGSR